MPCSPSLTQGCPPLEAGQQQQQWHWQPILTPTEPHGQAECLSVCQSVCSVPGGSTIYLDGGGCFWYLLQLLPGPPSSQTTGWTGLRAESAGPMDVASQGGV